MNLFLDFETFYSTADKYGLRHMSLVEYVRDPRFKVFGLAVAADAGEPSWIRDPDDYEAITWSESTIVSHNTKFDGFILRNVYGIKPKAWIDTVGMARAVLGNRVKDFSLKTLAEYYGLEPKGELKTDGLHDLSEADEAQLAKYCCHDTWLCREIFNRLNKGFPESQYPYLDWSIRTFVEPKLQLNVSLLGRANEDEKARRTTIFDQIGIKKEVFASNVKFPELLRSKGYEVPTKKSPSTGKQIPALSVGDTRFLDMVDSNDPQLKSLCEARLAAKSALLETRTAKLAKIGKTGPWPFDIKFSGALQTHRFSGGDGAGGNPQNFTRGSALRRAVEAPEGYSLIVGDFASIEMRIVAYLAKERGLTELIESHQDVYCDFASAFYGRTITKADEVERRFGKTAILGLGYGMGPTKFKDTVQKQTGQKIKDQEAKKAVGLYRMKYNKVVQLWDYLDSRIAGMLDDKDWTIWWTLPARMWKECLVLPSGLKLQYPNLRKEADEWVYDMREKKSGTTPTKLYGGKLLENIVQALAGELCKEAMFEFRDVCTGLVHDEIHLLVRDEDATETATSLYYAMTTPPKWLPELKLEAEIGIGKNWLEAK